MKTSLLILCFLGIKTIHISEKVIFKKVQFSAFTYALPHVEQRIHCVDEQDCIELGIGAFCCQST